MTRSDEGTWPRRWWPPLLGGVALVLAGLSSILGEDDVDLRILGVLVVTGGALLAGSGLMIRARRSADPGQR